MIVAQLIAKLGVQVDQSKIDSAFKSVLGHVTAIAGAAAAINLGKRLFGSVMHATEAATHLVSMSHAIGLTIEQTQEWGHVAERSGSSLTELSVGLNMMLRNLRLYSEGRGSKILRDRFREIGLSVNDAKEALASPDGFQAVLLKTSDSIKAMGDNGRQATMTQLFGVRAGRAMLADMARGSAGLEELFERRRKMGELNKEEALQMRDLDNRVRDVKSNWEALVSKTVAKMAPRLIELALATTTWMQANGPLISGLISGAVDVLTTVMGVAADQVKMLFDAFHDPEMLERLFMIGGIIAALIVPPTIAWAVATLAALAPYIVIGAAIGMIAYGIYELSENWDAYAKRLDEWSSDLLNSVTEPFIAIGEFFAGLAESIKDGFWESIDSITDSFWGFIDTCKEGLHDLWEDVKDIPIVGWLIDNTGKAISATADFLGGDIGGSGIGGLVPNLSPNIPSTVNSAGTKTTNVNMGGTTVNITTGANPKDAATAVQDAEADRMRHAQRAVGGE